jgi:beta-lactamase
MKELQELTKLIEEEIKNGAFPGANYAIVTPQRTYLGTVGNKSLIPSIQKNTIDTIYDMASLSKVLATTTCIFKLMEEGKIRTASKVQTYLPQFAYKHVTIWHLLTHTSGLPEGISGLLTMKSAKDVYKKIFSTPLVYETGMQIKYSDLGYVLLGLIIEKIENRPLDEVIKEKIFLPLDMIDTTYNPKDLNRCAPTELRNDDLYQGILQGSVHDEMAFLLNGVAGHAGVFSTVKDVSHFITMILNNGKYNDQQILSPTTIDLMFTPQVHEKSGVICKETIRGLGWLIGGFASSSGDLTSNQTIHHTGFTGTSIFIDRSNEIGFCLLTNRVHPTRNTSGHIEARGKIANYIMANYQKFK